MNAESSSGGHVLDGDPAQLAGGAVLAGRWRIRGHLGRGGMGHVYSADDDVLGVVVALKVLVLRGDPARALDRFRDEARLARRVTHPNVARTYDVGAHDEMRFITMELVDGESLRARLRRERALPVAEVARVCAAAADGLAAAHAVGVVHRDVKPGNVLLAYDRVVLIDFGIATDVLAPSDEGRGVPGTYDYVAPEVLLGAAATAASDVYGLGAMLFEAMAGERPFPGATPRERAHARVRGDAPDLRDRVHVPDDAAALVAACLARAPARRPDAATVARALRDLDAAWDSQRTEILDAPLTRAQRPAGVDGPVLAVLPPRVAGDDPHAQARGVGAVVWEELVDVLATTRGVQVLAARAVDGAAGVDARAAGRDLHADLVLDTSFRVEGEGARPRLRVAARLVDVERGAQRWADAFVVDARKALELEHALANAVAEALRIELTTRAHAPPPPDVVAEWVEVRQAARQGARGEDLPLLARVDACVARAPDFPPAIATRAVAHARAWLFPRHDDDADRATPARAAVADALARAEHVPDTHLAAAIVAEQEGRYGDAAKSLRRAIALAPSCALAHEALGRLEMEAGMVADGARRLRFAASVDPRCASSMSLVARACALRGLDAQTARALARAERATGPGNPELLLLRMRLAVWRGDRLGAAALRDALGAVAERPRLTLGAYLSVATGVDPFALDAYTVTVRAHRSPRWTTTCMQLAAEALAATDPAAAFVRLTRAVDEVLVDVDWMTLCPALAPLREQAGFAALRARVEGRAAEVR